MARDLPATQPATALVPRIESAIGWEKGRVEMVPQAQAIPNATDHNKWLSSEEYLLHDSI